MNTKILVLVAMFGSLAFLLTFIYVSFPPWGDVTPATTPISVISTVAPWPIGVCASLIKGVGASIWTGEWFMEIPVGIGDSLMSAFTYFLVKKKVTRTHAAIVGQLSRYLFTSGIVALYIGTVASIGIPSPLGGDIIGKLNNYGQKIGFNLSSPFFFSSVSIVWLARVPAMTISILVNILLSVLILRTAGKQISAFINNFIEPEKAKKDSVIDTSSVHLPNNGT
jgi:hypothetical protein